MEIPIFLSCPSNLTEDQQALRDDITEELRGNGLQPRTVGVSDYAYDNPLREVLVLARHCAGGLILGFEETRIDKAMRKTDGRPYEDLPLPSVWNNLEAGILYALGLPLLVFREAGIGAMSGVEISSGIFDQGVTDLFLQKLKTDKEDRKDEDYQTGRRSVILAWRTQVQRAYYSDPFGRDRSS